MDKLKNKIVIMAIVVCLIIIGTIITILLLNNKEKNNIAKNDKNEETYVEKETENLQKELRNPTEFFSVEKSIQNNIDQNFIAKKMNYIKENNIITYSVEGSLNNSIKYLIVMVDTNNMTCEIEELEGGNYNNINDIKLNNNGKTEIPNNGNNYFKYEEIKKDDMCRKYLEDFKQKALNNPEEAYQLLDEEYKNKRFSGIEDFKEYINLLRGKIENSILSKYDVQNKEEYTEYILVDNYNNSYTIRTTGIWDYKILLDNYTIKVDTYEENYNELDVTQKVQSNVYIFLQMINTKDYSNAYELLDETFKQNNFDTLEKFKEYVNTNFFDYNLNTTSDVDIDNEGSIYIYKTKIKSGAGRTAETKNLTVIMQLKEGTDFVMSFSFE